MTRRKALALIDRLIEDAVLLDARAQSARSASELEAVLEADRVLLRDIDRLAADVQAATRLVH